MAQNLISASLSATGTVEMMQSITTVKSKPAFLPGMQSAGMAGITETGNTCIPFVKLAKQTAATCPEILPGVSDKEKFQHNYKLFSAIRPILAQLNEPLTGFEKTCYAVGTGTFVSAPEVYNALKFNKDKVPGLNATAYAIGALFGKTKRNPTILFNKTNT